MNEWKEYSLDDFAEVNPTERISKGNNAKKIPMELIQPFTKRIPGYSIEDASAIVRLSGSNQCLKVPVHRIA